MVDALHDAWCKGHFDCAGEPPPKQGKIKLRDDEAVWMGQALDKLQKEELDTVVVMCHGFELVFYKPRYNSGTLGVYVDDTAD